MAKRTDVLKEQIAFLEKHHPDSFDLIHLRVKLEKSQRGRGSKQKGSGYERTVKKLIKDFLGIELERTPLSGGFGKTRKGVPKELSETLKGDLNLLDRNKKFNLHVECKNQKTWSLKQWWKQTTEDCPKEKYPVIFLHQEQKNENGKRVQESDDFVFLRAKDFLALVDKEKIIEMGGKEND